MSLRRIAAIAVIVPFLADARPTQGAGSESVVIYLHGRIVQERQDARPRSEDFGHYELDRIRDELRSGGARLISDIRPRKVTSETYADKVVTDVRALLAQGVPADRITVVGASMGGAIALLASARLKNPDVRFAVLGVCVAQNDAAFRENGEAIVGRVLAIREESDRFTRGCPSWAGAGSASNEIILRTGLDHGFLYRPMKEWVGPVMEWIGGKPAIR